jgi:tetratricopeptide (TPR) repeat protein
MKKNMMFLSLIFVMGACAGSQDKKDNPSWAGKMQTTAQAFQDLLPYLYSEERFSDPKNSETIQSKISNYAKSIHTIDEKSAKTMLGDDPYVQQSLKSIQELTDRAQDSFKRGDRKNSRILLKATTTTCFKCHTRQNIGPETVYWKDFKVDQLDTNELEKAQILVAMRQYEEAKLNLKKYLSESETKGTFDIAYENALHYYLMISLRGQKTFQSTLNFLKAKMLIVKTPTELHYTIKHWHKDLSYWMKNQKKLKPNPKVAYQVLKRNKKRYSERNLVNDLVASSLLHQYLMTSPSNAEKSKAYRLLGQAYDELIVEGFWDLPEIYYEMCIHYSPRTQIAQNCFKRLKNNVTLGYSGSRGTMVPSQEYERLETLRKKAGF